MTIALLTIISLGYMKATGKTIPALEKRLNKVKNAKKNNAVTEITTIAEKEISSFDVKRLEAVPFKKAAYFNIYPKTYSGALKI